MDVLKLILQIALVVISVILVATILLHKGKGGGMSDMFGGGVTSSLGSSGVAQRNLTRISVTLAVIWVLIIVALGLMMRFTQDI